MNGFENHYKWPYKWVTGVITPMSRVMGPYLQLVFGGPPCRWFQRVSHVYPPPHAMIQMSNMLAKRIETTK